MGVLDNNKDFLKQNVSQINGKVQNVYFCLNFLPMALFLGNVFEAWEIPNTYLLKIQVLISSLSLVNFLVYKFLDLPDFTKYLGIFSCTTIVSIIAANGRVGIYISYGFFPFLASLYYSKKCTRIVSLYSWIAMMVSMYIKIHKAMRAVYCRNLYARCFFHTIHHRFFHGTFLCSSPCHGNDKDGPQKS